MNINNAEKNENKTILPQNEIIKPLIIHILDDIKLVNHIAFAEEIYNGSNLIVLDKFCDTEIPFDIEKIDWEMQVTSSPNSYLLYLHGFNPIYFLTDAYIETTDRKYLDFAGKIIDSWREYNEKTEPKVRQAWYDHTVSLRAENLIFFVSAMTESDKEYNASMMYAILEEHAEWLSDEKNYVKNHNHGIFEDIALYKLGLFINKKIYCDKAYERLEQQIKYAYPYIVHIENSMGYNIGMLDLLEKLNFLFVSDGSGLHTLIERVISKSMEFLLYAYRPNLSLPAYGDTFGALSDTRGSIKDWDSPYLEWISSNGKRGEKPDKNTAFFRDDGYAFARSSFDAETMKDAAWLMFRSGFNNITHKHKDDLSVVWFAKDRNILIDPGMYNYMQGSKYHDYTNSVSAHCSVSVDDNDYYIGENVTNRAGMLDFVIENGGCRFKGYNNLYYGVCIDRDIISINENTLVIIDNMQSDKTHKYTQTFHFHEDVRIESVDTNTMTAAVSDEWKLSIRQIEPVENVRITSGESSDGDMSVRSIGMNKVTPTNSVMFETQQKQFVSVLQLYREQQDLYDCAKMNDHLLLNGQKYKLSARKRFQHLLGDMRIVDDTLVVISDDEDCQVTISLLNQSNGKVMISKKINQDDYGSVAFTSLRNDLRYAVKRITKKGFETLEELLGFVSHDDKEFCCEEIPNEERRPFVLGQSFIKEEETYRFKIQTIGFHSTAVKWYIYRNGASFDYKNGDDEFEYTFKEPGVYFVAFRILDRYFGEIAKGNFAEIKISSE